MLYSSISTIGNNVLLDTLLGCQTNKLMPSTNLQYEQFLSQTIAQLEESASAYSGERVENMYAHMNGTTDSILASV